MINIINLLILAYENTKFLFDGNPLLILNFCENDNLELSKDQLSQTQWSDFLKEANVPYNCDINISLKHLQEDDMLLAILTQKANILNKLL